MAMHVTVDTLLDRVKDIAPIRCRTSFTTPGDAQPCRRSRICTNSSTPKVTNPLAIVQHDCCDGVAVPQARRFDVEIRYGVAEFRKQAPVLIRLQ